MRAGRGRRPSAAPPSPPPDGAPRLSWDGGPGASDFRGDDDDDGARPEARPPGGAHRRPGRSPPPQYHHATTTPSARRPVASPAVSRRCRATPRQLSRSMVNNFPESVLSPRFSINQAIARRDTPRTGGSRRGPPARHRPRRGADCRSKGRPRRGEGREYPPI